MTQQPQKLQGKFYPLTTEEIIELSSLLTDTELKILLYLKSLNPFTDSFRELDTAIIAEHLGVTRRTAQRIVKKFEQLGLIRLEVTRFKYSINALKSDPRIAKRQQDRQSDSRIAIAV